jgi:hypothetical protein
VFEYAKRDDVDVAVGVALLLDEGDDAGEGSV